jgi:hypothetical protein
MRDDSFIGFEIALSLEVNLFVSKLEMLEQ